MSPEQAYYLTIFLCLFFNFFEKTIKKYNLISVLIILLLPLNFLGYSRAESVDLENYRRIYNGGHYEIFDIVFVWTAQFIQKLGVDFVGFLYLLGALKTYAFIQLAKKYDVNLMCILILDFSYFFFLRDLAQIRMGVAFTFLLLGYLQPQNIRAFIFIIFASATHITSLPIGIIILLIKLRIKNWKLIWTYSVCASAIVIFEFREYLINFIPKLSHFYKMYQLSDHSVGATNFSGLAVVLSFLTLTSLFFFGGRRCISTERRHRDLVKDVREMCFGMFLVGIVLTYFLPITASRALSFLISFCLISIPALISCIRHRSSWLACFCCAIIGYLLFKFKVMQSNSFIALVF